MTPELEVQTAPFTALDLLYEASTTIDNRAVERDLVTGERSMRRAIDMFNAWRGEDLANGMLSELEGWVFMVFLKLSRAAGGRYRRDDYVDGSAYIALAGEAAEREQALVDAVLKARGK